MIDQRISKIKVRRGTDSQRVTNTFEEGEVIYSVDKKRIFVGDDVTLGGVPVSNRNYIVNSLGVPPVFPDGVLEGDIVHDKSNSKTYIVNSNNGTLELLLLADGNQSSIIKTQISDIYTKLRTLTGCLTPTPPPTPPPPPPPSKLNWAIQPSNFSINEGNSVTFSSSAVGDGSITYEWKRRDGLTINTSNVFQKSFTINKTRTSDTSTYYCIASNAVDSITSRNAYLTIIRMEVSRHWRSVAMSSDGTKQTAVALNQIYISTDSGNTWTAKESSRAWQSVAMSSDGTKQTAVVLNGKIYISSDSGNTWTAKESDNGWHSVAMSSDGTKQTAVAHQSQIYISSDSGNTWTAKGSSVKWYSVAMSSDGTKQTALYKDSGFGQIYISSDSGNTWTAKGSARDWNSVAMSSDGTIQTAVVRNGRIYISTDSGNTWTDPEPAMSSKEWMSVAMSSDGTKQTALGEQIYISNDSGNTWTSDLEINYY